MRDERRCRNIRPVGFPFLFGGTFIEGWTDTAKHSFTSPFPFLFGGTFIEGAKHHRSVRKVKHNFPSFSEGLSLREWSRKGCCHESEHFPSFSEGLSLRAARLAGSAEAGDYFPSFSEGLSLRAIEENHRREPREFPFLFGGTFIEGQYSRLNRHRRLHFPSFSEGLSLRVW